VATPSRSQLLLAALTFPLANGLTGGCSNTPAEDVIDCDASPGRLYSQKIKPLLESDRPDSCSQCHTGGVALEMFVRGSACEAMACLKEEGLVDLNQPELSVLLSWIGRAEPDSKLITQEILDEESAAFLQWFEYEAACQACADVECPDPGDVSCEFDESEMATSYDADSDPGDCSADTLERLFRGTVYWERGRCAPCHFDSELSAVESAPRFIADHGSCQVGSLATMNRILDAGYMNLSKPKKSLLLLKPLPEEAGGVPHGGHDKFATTSDPAYEAFLLFIKRYAACQKP
jgi:hypothetical protein